MEGSDCEDDGCEGDDGLKVICTMKRVRVAVF